MSRGRALRTGIAFDMRTGFKVRGRKLAQDGEKPGIWTTRDNVDQRHPQRYVNVPPPDGLTYRPGPPAMHAIGARVDMAWVMLSDSSYNQTDGTIEQPFGVLRKVPAPRFFVHCTFSAFHTSFDAEPGPLTWGGWELQWDGVPIIWGDAAQ